VEALTPAERRGALVVLCLLVLGTGRDLWRATRPPLVPSPPTSAERADSPAAAPDSAAGPAKDAAPPGWATLDLNRATAIELDALPGIGPVLAERIVEHRRRHGPFASREELLAVRGIGPRLLARIGARVRVGSNGTMTSGRPDSGDAELRPDRR
jgi:competence ComEA-like helix-hairpin-helix protein